MEDINKVIDESIQGSATLIEPKSREGKKLYIESYGCQMNFSDSEIVASILADNGFNTTKNIEEADVVFVNTCSIREKAEFTVRNRLKSFTKYKKQKPEMIIGVLGCMAERVKSQLLDEEKLVDIVVGPDAYRDLPNLINQAEDGRKAVNVILSKEETYADINPVRLLSNGVTAFISITRGCDNMCTFCVVPFTRGRERSRNPESILNEAKDLFEKGYREVTLLGQNVDSYLWYGQEARSSKTEDRSSKFEEKTSEMELLSTSDLKNIKNSVTSEFRIPNSDLENIENGVTSDFRLRASDLKNSRVNFAQLMEQVALISPLLRVRFSTSHPKDISDDFLRIMAKYDNICDYIHLPFQSGNSRVLELMNRGYTAEWYKERIDTIKKIVPKASLSADIIAGFCSETEEEHQNTLELMDYVKFDYAYMFSYSERPNTLAQRKLKDDVSDEDKQKRLAEIIALQNKHSLERNRSYVGKTFQVLVEGVSKKSANELQGRTPQNSVLVFPKEQYKIGDYVNVYVHSCTGGTLIGKAIKD